MSDNNDHKDDQERKRPPTREEAGWLEPVQALERRATGYAVTRGPVPATMTSIAVSSAALYAPDKTIMVKTFVRDVEPLDDATLALIRSGTMQPAELGIDTQLEHAHVEILTEAVLGDRSSKEQRTHDETIARITARGPVWAEIVKLVGAALIGAIAALWGQSLL